MPEKHEVATQRATTRLTRLSNLRAARIGVAAVVLAAVLVAGTVHGGAIGTLCQFCPVGFLAIGVSSGEVPWGLIPGVLIALATALVLGKAFCAWACPTGLLKTAFGLHPKGEGPTARRSDYASQGIVLVVLLAVSFIVGFPVFCLICPIGLALGIVYAVARMFILWQPGWELLVFPLMLLAEVVLFRRWCSKICPIGFVLGFFAWVRGKLGFSLMPKVDGEVCQRASGCHGCASICPEGIDVAVAQRSDARDCTLCLECKEACPSKALDHLR